MNAKSTATEAPYVKRIIAAVFSVMNHQEQMQLIDRRVDWARGSREINIHEDRKAP